MIAPRKRFADWHSSDRLAESHRAEPRHDEGLALSGTAWSMPEGLFDEHHIDASAPGHDPGVVTTAAGRTVSAARLFWLRLLFGLDVVGAGGPGLLLLFAPELADRWLFAGRLEPGMATSILGCVWLSIGLAAFAGLFRPLTFSPVLCVQMAYKAIWLCLVGVPTLWSGAQLPVVLTLIFAGWVLAVGLVLPWRIIVSRDGSGAEDAGTSP